MSNQKASLERAADKIEDLQRDIRKLERQVEALAITCQALWEMLRDQESGLTEEAVLEKVKEIDLRDGTEDGRMTVVPLECPACKRKSGSKRRECVYCGAALPPHNLFEVI